MRTGVEFISSCVCMDIIIVPSCTMFDRANSASSSRVEYWSARVEYERSSARGPIFECSSSTSARVLEFYTLKLASKSARTRRSRLSSA